MSFALISPEVSEARRHQCFTPEWAAELLVSRYFAELGPDDLVCEPACGLGAFLKAIPSEVPAFGVELDGALVPQAEANTGREILHGDFYDVALPEGITAILGNPPFRVPTIERFMQRAEKVLEPERVCGLILPASALTTYTRMNRWLDVWSIEAEVLPRSIFEGLPLTLLFVRFTRSFTRRLVGFTLFDEAVAMQLMAKPIALVAKEGSPQRGVWRAVVEEAMGLLGGEATLADIYRVIDGKQPTPNAFWREKVRQQLQLHFEPVRTGVWRMPSEVAA